MLMHVDQQCAFGVLRGRAVCDQRLFGRRREGVARPDLNQRRRSDGSEHPLFKVAAAYPICTITWLIVPSHVSDPNKLRSMKEFLRWIYSDEGSRIALTTNYGVLRPPLLDSVRDQVANIH